MTGAGGWARGGCLGVKIAELGQAGGDDRGCAQRMAWGGWAVLEHSHISFFVFVCRSRRFVICDFFVTAQIGWLPRGAAGTPATPAGGMRAGAGEANEQQPHWQGECGICQVPCLWV